MAVFSTLPLPAERDPGLHRLRLGVKAVLGDDLPHDFVRLELLDELLHCIHRLPEHGPEGVGDLFEDLADGALHRIEVKTLGDQLPVAHAEGVLQEDALA